MFCHAGHEIIPANNRERARIACDCGRAIVKGKCTKINENNSLFEQKNRLFEGKEWHEFKDQCSITRKQDPLELEQKIYQKQRQEREERKNKVFSEQYDDEFTNEDESEENQYLNSGNDKDQLQGYSTLDFLEYIKLVLKISGK